MKKAALVFLATAVLGAVMTAATTLPAASQPPEERTTVAWFDPNRTDFEKRLNLGGRGEAGDMAVVKDSMFDPETCEKEATILLRFQFVKPAGENDAFFLVDGGLLLSDGKLTISVPGRFSEFENETGAAGAVTGGTGAYRDATGEFFVVEDQELCGKKGALITADLVLQ